MSLKKLQQSWEFGDLKRFNSDDLTKEERPLLFQFLHQTPTFRISIMTRRRRVPQWEMFHARIEVYERCTYPLYRADAAYDSDKQSLRL